MAGVRWTRKKYLGPGPLELADRSIHILRSAPASLLSTYYLGSLPFVLGFLYFTADMSRSGMAAERCSASAAGLAVLFLWMKFFQALFARKIEALVAPGDKIVLSFDRVWFVVSSQAIIQASGLAVVPLALSVFFPFAWVYAFYQNATALAFSDALFSSGKPRLKRLVRDCMKEAARTPGDNHVLLAVLSFLYFVVFVNIAVFILLFPYLLKSFLGIETRFTLSGLSVLNTTFLTAVCGLTYLCADPVVKAAYALRCFYGQGMENGKDLIAELRRLQRQRRTGYKNMVATATEKRKGMKKGGVWILVFFLFLSAMACFPGFSPVATAENAPAGSDGKDDLKSPAIVSEQLDQAIRETLEEREFAWRLPRSMRNDEENEEHGAIYSLFKWIRDTLTPPVKAVLQWIEKAVDWILDRLPEPSYSPKTPESRWRDWVRGGLVGLIALLSAVLAFLTIRYRNSKKAVLEAVGAVSAIPDIEDENVVAGDYPQDEWTRLGEEFLKRGELEKSLRAFFLATLSALSEAGLIVSAKYKSNMEYLSELDRRASDKKDLVELVSSRAHFFERVRYGGRRLTVEEAVRYAAEQDRVTALC